ncbi:MAG: cell division inhibitor [Aequorivita sp.]|jgi:ligand-binding SRPBCC domain-containing protein|nr:cell division inhibitor [Aequorivita sp.]MBF31414.1 cell division inhibitor [Aequorivita sp.]HBL79368.1 cell division inhibitor [Aequorivita sp.]|tara:strand:+ start:78556 stop:79017 length:462 start_codon:yes stop_codon:yes gene_type:complete
MKIYTLHAIQNLPISREQAWQFLSDPKNLKVITPDYMGFNIQSGADRTMYAGQIIEYIVTPILGIKNRWVTEITHVVDQEYFVDEQRFGPYALWHHKHFIKEIEGGVEMEDLLHYKLPFGYLGQLAHPFLVKPKLDEIFEYRKNKLVELFGSM